MFTIKGYACDISETKFFEIFIKKWTSNSLNDVDHTDVTTKVQSIAKCMPSLTFVIIEITNSKFINFYLSPILVHHIWFYFT